MRDIKKLKEKIEIQRTKLNISLDSCNDLQAAYEQNLQLDYLIEEYIKATEPKEAVR